MALLKIDDCPPDPIQAIVWLDGVLEQVNSELSEAYAKAYFEARLQRRFDEAVLAGHTPRKRALAWTRMLNERLGRTVRWNDGLDPTSSAYADPAKS